MNINTNRWNRIRYTVYVPVYDLIGKIFSRSRRKAIGLLKVNPGDGVLLVGAGTGLDIEFIPEGSKITATDITPAMINRIRKNYKDKADAIVMDGHHLEFQNQSFDNIILHLILAVIPDPVKCLQEAERVLKPGGRISVFDKFLNENEKPTLIRRLLNVITSALFSDINRNFNTIHSATTLKIIHQENADFGGNFKIIILEKSYE